MNVGGPELLIILVLMLSVVVPIVTIVDIASKPAWAFEAANVNRMLFIVLAALGIVFCGIGLIVGIVWVAGFRSKVVAAAAWNSPGPTAAAVGLMPTPARTLLAAGLVLALSVVTACSESDSSQVSADPAAGAIAPWESGTSVGTVLGPFPIPPEPGVTTPQGSWFSAVLPSGDPIEAFEAVVADAEEHGYEAFAESTGACRVAWSREEVPFDVDEGTDDGLGFGGDVAVGEPLPDGADVEGVNCRAVVTRGDERILVTVAARGSSTPAFPPRTAVLLSSGVEVVPDAGFESVAVDVEVERRHDGPPTDRELESFGADEEWSGSEIVDVALPGLQCKAIVTQSEMAVRQAVTDAFDKALHGYPEELAVDPTIVTTTVRGRPAATAVAIVPADGPVVYAMATETDTGSSQLFCRRQF